MFHGILNKTDSYIQIMANKKTFFYYIYNILMAILAVISIVLIILDYAHEINITSNPYNIFDNSILVLFTIDYFIRLVISKDKKEFFKNNIFDLLSIIPSIGFFSLFRINRLGRLFRALRFLRIVRLVGLVGRLEKLLKINGLVYYLYISLGVMLITASLFCVSEKVSFETALWWSITTATTVGYGDVSPATGIGKLAAVVDMLVGIGLVGLLTSSITSLFDKSNEIDIQELKMQNEKLVKQNEELIQLLKNKD